MRVRVAAAVVLALVAGALPVAGAQARHDVFAATCTPAQKAQHRTALATYRKHMSAARSAYFAHHKRASLRRAFVRGQHARLKSLETAAACTVTAAGRLAELSTYAQRMTMLSPQFDPTLTVPVDDAIATITSDEENCDADPEDFDCPVPAAEYQATAKTLRDAAAMLKGLTTKLRAITPPTMSVGAYDNVPADCGEELVTIAAAHKAFSDSIAKWDATLERWAATYASGTSPDWDTLDYVPNASNIWDEPNQALHVWAVFVNSYWTALAQHVTSAPAVPQWISDVSDEECPPPD